MIGNRTLCHPIQSVIIKVIKQIGLSLCGHPILLITCMIIQTELDCTQSYMYYNVPLLKDLYLNRKDN